MKAEPKGASKGFLALTRLRTGDIADIAENLEKYDAELVLKTGCTLLGVACAAAGVDESLVRRVSKDVLVGIVPITSGKGIIAGFSHAVERIVKHIGFSAFVTESSDVAGLVEAFDKKADVIMLSDDERFVAIHVRSQRVVNNEDATGKGFVSGLSLMTRSLSNRNVLVVGCGPVGQSATMALIGLGAVPGVFDVVQRRGYDLAETIQRSQSVKIRVENDLNSALATYRYIIDASPARDIINRFHVRSDTYISAPGMPTGLNAGALKKLSGRYLHDPLQIGVATMIVEVTGESGN
jgi:pyrrolysine biosynthesis protein PylD